MIEQEETLTANEVAAAFRVSRRTVYKWERAGLLVPSFRTPGGRARYRTSEIHALLGEFPLVHTNEES